MSMPIAKFAADTSKSGFIIRKDGFTATYTKTVGSTATIGVNTSPPPGSSLWRWSAMLAFNVTGIPVNAIITEVGIDWKLNISQPICSATWDNDIFADGAGGIIGSALDGTAGEYAGTGGTLIIPSYNWNASPPTNFYLQLGISGSDIVNMVTPGTDQQFDFALPQFAYSPGDNCTRNWELGGKVPSKLWITYILPPQKGNSFNRLRRGISTR